MADIRYAVYKIFNGTDFDTIYFKAPALAITESDDKQFISKANKTLITNYLTTFNAANKLVQLGTDGKIPSTLINENFGNYLDKRSSSGLQNVGSKVNFTHTDGIFTPYGINLTLETAIPANTNNISTITGGVKLSVGLDASNQEITFTKDGILDFKKSTEIKNVKLGADSSAVPKSYVDTVTESGAKPIASVKAATAASFDPIPSGESVTPDGISVKAGDRVLLKDQENDAENGIYEVTTGVWARITEDSDLKGALVFVKEGLTNNDSKWFHKGDGEWIQFSQTDQLSFSGGLVRSADNVKLATNYIANNHIKTGAAIDLDKLGNHVGSTSGWDLDETPVPKISNARSVGDRLEDLALTIKRIRGGVGIAGDYGEWSANSLTMVGINNTAKAKQNPVRFGTAAPSASLYDKGDVYLLYDQTTP